MNELHALLSKNLKILRAYRGLTQDGLAEAAGMSKNYLAEIETGRKYPSADLFLQLSRALGVQPYLLLMPSGGSGRHNEGNGSAPIDDFKERMAKDVADFIVRYELLPAQGATDQADGASPSGTEGASDKD